MGYNEPYCLNFNVQYGDEARVGNFSSALALVVVSIHYSLVDAKENRHVINLGDIQFFMNDCKFSIRPLRHSIIRHVW